MTLENLTIRVRSSFWYLPCLYGIAALFAAYLTIKLDAIIGRNEVLYSQVPSIFLSDINLAQTILSSISASLLTMTTITFSTILVVLTTYLSQFSPRTLQNFITDHSTQRVLGIFVGGFIYAILLLLLLREDEFHTLFIVPVFAVIIAIVCLIVFVFFIHHVTTWIQVSNLIHDITVQTISSIEANFKDKDEVTPDPPWDDWESDEIKHITPRIVTFNKTGYIQLIDVVALVEQARKDDSIIRIEKNLGDYIDQDTPLFSIWNFRQPLDINNYIKHITVGAEKAPIGDIQFGLTKLVEIALRALSPGINDPNTAVNSIEQLDKILTKLGKKHLPRPYHNDGDRNLRVIYEMPTYGDYLYRCFYQIRQYGSKDISVLVAIIKALTLIAEANSKDIKNIIWDFGRYIMEGVDQESFLSLDRKYIHEKLLTLAKATGQNHEIQANLED